MSEGSVRARTRILHRPVRRAACQRVAGTDTKRRASSDRRGKCVVRGRPDVLADPDHGMSARHVAAVSRNPVLQGFVALYSSRVFTQVANVILGFWVAGVLGPQNFGFWKAVDLIQQYHPFTALGVQNAMTLEVPYAL